MTTTSGSKSTLRGDPAENLLRWAEITALALALREAVLKKDHEDTGAMARVYKEIRSNKEDRWKKTLS